MTTLEELLEIERSAVDPTDEEQERAARKVAAAIGFGVVTVASTTTVSSSAAVASGASGNSGLATVSGATSASSATGALQAMASSKFAALWGAKAALGWGAGTLGVGLVIAASVFPLDSQSPAPSTTVLKSSGAHLRQERPPTEPTPEAKHGHETEGESPSKGTVDRPQPNTAPSHAVSAIRAEVSSSNERTSPRKATTERAPATQTQGAAPSPNSLQEDARLLSQVSAALNGGRYRDALSLMDGKLTHRSALASEFSAARAVALCSLGRQAEGKAQVAALEKWAPESPALLRVKRACSQ